jgi:hypothetical protein
MITWFLAQNEPMNSAFYLRFVTLEVSFNLTLLSRFTFLLFESHLSPLSQVKIFISVVA